MLLKITFFISSLFFLSSSYSEVIKFAVSDIAGLEELKTNFGKFQEELSKAVGVEIKLYPISSRTVAVEALKNKKVDLILTGPAEYVVIKKKINIRPIVRFSRPDYFSVIVVLAETPIYTIPDLKNKKIAFGDFGSTAYHLGPLQLLADYNLKPKKDYKYINTSKHIGWRSLLRKDVQALGIKDEQFKIFRENTKDYDFRVIGRGPDLPSDVLVAGSHLDPKYDQILKDTFINNSQILINSVLKSKSNKKYENMRFEEQVKDSDYDYIREMYKTAGYSKYSNNYE